MDMAFDDGKAALTIDQVAGDYFRGKPSRG